MEGCRRDKYVKDGNKIRAYKDEQVSGRERVSEREGKRLSG